MTRNTPDEVTLDGYVDTTERQNTIFTANIVKEGMLGGLGHTLLAGVESISTSSDQDRYNTFWDTTQDDKETFSVSRNLGIRGGVGQNALGALATNDFGVDVNDDTRVEIDVTSVYVQDEIELSNEFRLLQACGTTALTSMFSTW